jgi:hypothetical protein
VIIILGTILSDPDGKPYFTSLDGFVAKGFLCFFTDISNQNQLNALHGWTGVRALSSLLMYYVYGCWEPPTFNK